jgi:hypothetical protein
MNVKISISALIASCGLHQSAQAWLPTHAGRNNGVGASTSWSFSVPYASQAALPSKSMLRSVVDGEAPSATISLSTDELKIVEDLFAKCKEKADGEPKAETLMEAVFEALPTMPPKLIVKLRQSETNENASVREVARSLNALLKERLEVAKETLMGLLNAGEVRKLDGLIGKAAREGRLDAAFFNVLTVNLQDAIVEAQQIPAEVHESTEGAATRAQILQHIYTRCQEEVEKTIPPGIALLNKLLRTQQESIRANLYSHYLTPQSDVIETPDGKKVELKNAGPNILVPLDDFIKAIDTAVVQVRTVENAGGTDRDAAASMVEACRQISKEARIIIGKHYGLASEELEAFEKGLQPVFRPTSRDSPYIQGQT